MFSIYNTVKLINFYSRAKFAKASTREIFSRFCRMVAKTKWMLIRFARDNKLSLTNLSLVNREIESPRIKTGLQYIRWELQILSHSRKQSYTHQHFVLLQRIGWNNNEEIWFLLQKQWQLRFLLTLDGLNILKIDSLYFNVVNVTLENKKNLIILRYTGDKPFKISETPLFKLLMPSPRILSEKSRINRTHVPLPFWYFRDLSVMRIWIQRISCLDWMIIFTSILYLKGTIHMYLSWTELFIGFVKAAWSDFFVFYSVK